MIYVCRYDLLCLEGLIQALRVFGKKEEAPEYRLANISNESMIKMQVKQEVSIILEIKRALYFSCFLFILRATVYLQIKMQLCSTCRHL